MIRELMIAATAAWNIAALPLLPGTWIGYIKHNGIAVEVAVHVQPETITIDVPGHQIHGRTLSSSDDDDPRVLYLNDDAIEGTFEFRAGMKQATGTFEGTIDGDEITAQVTLHRRPLSIGALMLSAD